MQDLKHRFTPYGIDVNKVVEEWADLANKLAIQKNVW